MAKQKSLSYKKLMSMNHTDIENLATAGMLDEKTLDRLLHIGRFFSRVGEMVPANLTVGDALTEDDLQTVWRDTAAEGTEATIGRHPLLH